MVCRVLPGCQGASCCVMLSRFYAIELAMGAPTSGPIAEFFLQNLEHIHLIHLSNKHKITGYFRCVDDVLLIYDSNHINIQSILDDFNAMHPNLNFTAETETNNKINYLDLTCFCTSTRPVFMPRNHIMFL